MPTPSLLDFGQIIKLVADEVNGALKVNIVAGTITTSSASVGLNGAIAPTSSDQVGGTDNNGNLKAISITAAGAVKTDSSATTQPVTGSGNFTVIQPTGTNLHTVIDSGTVSATQSGTWDINNVSGTISLPTGASTSAKQPALGTAGSASTDVITVQGIASMTALKVDGSATTQPVSGTVTANIGTTNGLALDSSLTTIDTDIKASQPRKMQDGAGNALTSQLNGAQRALDVGIDVAGVQIDPRSIRALTSSDVVTVVQPTGTNLHTVVDSGTIAATQSGSWTVTANAGTNLNTSALALDTSVNGILVSQSSTTSGEKGPLIQAAVTTAAPTYVDGNTNPLSLTTSGALRTDSSATTQPVSGTITANAGTGNFTVVQSTGTNLHTVVDSGTIAATQSGTWNINNISGTVSLPTGAATETTLAKLTLSQGSTTSGESGPLIQGAVTTAAPTYTTAQTSPLSLTTAGALRTDSSATTQPISGTVSATQSGTWSIRTQDGSGNALTSVVVGAHQALDVYTDGYVNSEFARNDYTSVNVTTAAYTQLIASTANEYQELQIFDSSGQTLKLATGGVGVEVDKIIIPPGGTSPIKLRIASGTRISIKAVSATANTGEIDLQLLG